MTFNIYNSNDINEIILILNDAEKQAEINNDYEFMRFFETLVEIVKQWKYDNSQWDFKSDHYRQAVSFLMRVAEETPEDEQPEYFEARFFDTMRNYSAIEKRYKERKGK